MSHWGENRPQRAVATIACFGPTPTAVVLLPRPDVSNHAKLLMPWRNDNELTGSHRNLLKGHSLLLAETYLNPAVGGIRA